MRNIQRVESPDVLLVQPQKFPAGGKFVVHDIKNLSVDTFLQSSQSNRVRTVIDVGERNRIRATDVQKDSEGVDTDSVREVRFSGTIHCSRPNDNVWNPKRRAILPYE